MKTTEEVCRQFGFEYAPMRISFKKKVLLSDLTPKSPETRLLRELFIIIGISLGALILGLIIIATVAS